MKESTRTSTGTRLGQKEGGFQGAILGKAGNPKNFILLPRNLEFSKVIKAEK